jgi:hypothetical protein
VCDTIIEDFTFELNNNWMACSVSDKPDVFRTVTVNDKKITRINEKGEIYYDYAYVGVAGIFEYEEFWSELENILNNNTSIDLSDCHVFMELLLKTVIKVKVVDGWHDTGNVENLNKTREFYEQKYKVLDKHEESIYFVDDFVIKFFSDPVLCKNRVQRASLLKRLVPKLLDYSNNFYKYELAEGELLSRVISEHKICELIDWAENNLWTSVDTDMTVFRNKCNNFYITKTKSRINKYLSLTGGVDKEDRINGILIPKCEDILESINWDKICFADSVRFHGDFILDNMLYDKGSFILLDWRQDFAGDIEAGDKYYDLSKLNHNLIFNHDIISQNGYKISIEKSGICCDILRSHNMVLCQQALMSKLEKSGYDLSKIRIITCLIWINMAPLHTYPLNNFLFYFGRYNLWRELCMNYI